MKALTQICWRDGDVISPNGVLKAWAEWVRLKLRPEVDVQTAKREIQEANEALLKAIEPKAIKQAQALKQHALHALVRAELEIENQAAVGWPSSSIEWRLMFSTRSGGDLTAPESAVEAMKHAAYLGEWCALILADCNYQQRRIVRHHYVDGMSYADIAMQLGGRPIEGVEPMAASEVSADIAAAQERLRRAIKAVVSSVKIAA